MKSLPPVNCTTTSVFSALFALMSVSLLNHYAN